MRVFTLVALPAALLLILARAEDPPCNTWEVEYALAAQLRISDTTMGVGNGMHTIGPGRLVLHFDDVNGQPGGSVRVIAYEMADHFTVDANVFGGATTIVNDTHTRATSNVCGRCAEGALRNGVLRWSTPWSGIHRDGRIECAGSMCGRMGAPRRGRSELHTLAHPAKFEPFVYGPDGRTFHMDYAVTDRSSSPRQTSSIRLSGRETRRAFVYVKPCP
jgi:hypothetical protein